HRCAHATRAPPDGNGSPPPLRSAAQALPLPSGNLYAALHVARRFHPAPAAALHSPAALGDATGWECDTPGLLPAPSAPETTTAAAQMTEECARRARQPQSQEVRRAWRSPESAPDRPAPDVRKDRESLLS